MDRHILFRAEIQGHCRQAIRNTADLLRIIWVVLLYFLHTSLLNILSLNSEKTFKNVTVLFCDATHVHLARDIGQCMRVVQVINHISSRS